MRREAQVTEVARVVTKTIDGTINEPMENTTIDVPEEYMGAVTQLMADRKGRMAKHDQPWLRLGRLQFTVPSRGLIGFRTALLSATRGTGISSSISAGAMHRWAAPSPSPNERLHGVRPSGVATPYAMQRLQARAASSSIRSPRCTKGQVVGVNNKPDELDVNITLAKHMTNMRSATADVLETLTPPIKMSLEGVPGLRQRGRVRGSHPESIRVRKIISTVRIGTSGAPSSVARTTLRIIK